MQHDLITATHRFIAENTFIQPQVDHASSCPPCRLCRALYSHPRRQAALRTGLGALIARRGGEKLRLFTRRAHDWTERYPAIAAAAVKLRARPRRRGWRYEPDCGFEPVSAKTQPVSDLPFPKFRILKVHRAETRPRNLGLLYEVHDTPRERPAFRTLTSGNVGTSLSTRNL
jgi:hypothetical protein